MGFKQGFDENRNYNGRPQGTKNKSELRQILKDVIENELETIQETLAQLEPEKRLNLLAKLLPYVLPKLETISINTDLKKPITLEVNNINEKKELENFLNEIE